NDRYVDSFSVHRLELGFRVVELVEQWVDVSLFVNYLARTVCCFVYAGQKLGRKLRNLVDDPTWNDMTMDIDSHISCTFSTLRCRHTNRRPRRTDLRWCFAAVCTLGRRPNRFRDRFRSF